MKKTSYPLSKVYALLEPGPVVLLTTAKGPLRNVMPMSWYTMLDFQPPLVGCVVSNRNYSFDLLRASRQCVINIPTVPLAQEVIRCGNSTGRKNDKFRRYGLTTVPARSVDAPLIAECFASLECKVVDTAMVRKYNFFVLEAVRAWVDRKAADCPKTLHHRGYGKLMVAGKNFNLPSRKR